jgi:hypothetical protein
MKQMAQIVYVSPCPNCVRGVCKIKKHHQLLYHRHQFVPILESASTSGSTTPNRLQMLEQSATSAGGLKSTPNQKQSKTADCRCLIQTILIISCKIYVFTPTVENVSVYKGILTCHEYCTSCNLKPF